MLDDNTFKEALTQEEIDNLLGDSSSDDMQHKHKGIKALIDRAMESYERLPMLEVIFERFISLLSTSLRNLTENNVNLALKSITSLRFGSYIDSIPLPALVVIFRAREWDTYGIIVANSNLIFSLVDILFGGKKLNRPTKVEGRPYTSIEQAVLKQLTDLILNDISESFGSLTKVKFLFERMETDPRFATIARPGDSAILTQINIDIEDKRGTIDILLPYSSLEPIRELLLQVFIGEQMGTDIEWQLDLSEKIKDAELVLKATLQGKPYKMKDILNFKVGSTIIMENSSDEDIPIMVENKKILSGKIGGYGDKIAILLNNTIQDIKDSENKK